MSKSKYIPEFTQTRVLCKDQSEIKLSKFVEKYNQGKKYGERIISSQINTIKTIIGELTDKLRHRLTTGRRFYITVGNLANMCKCSVKTAYNHICRLIDAGILRKAQTSHQFRSTDDYYTPCLLIEVSQEILIFQVVNSPIIVEKRVDIPKTYTPEVPFEGIETMKQFKIWPYDQ